MPPSVRTADSVTTSNTLSPPPGQRLSRIPRLSPTRTSSGRTDRATVATSAVASVGVTGLPAPVVTTRVQQHQQTLAHRHPPQQRTLLKPSSATSLARHATSTAMNGSAAVDAASGTQGGGGGDECSLGVQPSDTANSTVHAGDVGLHCKSAPHERRGKDMHPNTDKSSLSRPSRVPSSAPSTTTSSSRSAGGGSVATSARGKRAEMAGSGAAGAGGGAVSTSRRVGSKGVATSAS
jgi:hypothetical protein